MNGIDGRFAARGLAALMLAATLAGCARLGSERAGPVTTKTEAGTTTAPPASEAAARGGALVRFVHAAPGLAAVDLFAGDTRAFDGVTYKQVAAYRELPGASGVYRLRLAGQETAEPLSEKSQSFGTGRHHTVIAFPAAEAGLFSKGDAVEMRFIADEFEPPAAGRARVRVVNASPDLGDLDLYATGRAEPLVRGAKTGAATAYADAEPTTGAGLEVRRAGENITTLAVPGGKLEAGRLYTIFIVGATKGASKLEAFVVEDHLGHAPGH